MSVPLLSTVCETCGGEENLFHSVMGTYCRTCHADAIRHVKAKYLGKPERFGNVPICPYCGYVVRDAWELDLSEDDEREIECGQCLTLYSVSARLEVTYKTRRLEGSADA